VSSTAPTGPRPRVLVFSTNAISDMGIDLAGSSHMDYSSSVEVIALPCSGGVNPQWILHALKAGFDGVFVAADGPECSYLTDCVARTGKIVDQAQTLLRQNGLDPSRVKTAAICSVCAEPFVNHMKAFSKALGDLSSNRAAPPVPAGTP
jgi:F420-non-reducing hydrogenase iron-sulfur subunit